MALCRGTTSALCQAFFAVLLAAGGCHATVLEFGSNGEVFVDGKRQTERVENPDPETPQDRIAPSSKSYGPYAELAQEVALRHAGGRGPRAAGLDVVTFTRLFTELVRAESAFNPRALSPKGAQGLGQLMPATARALGVADPWDPVQNLDGAARYLCTQLERFGDARLALAAYNAGPHRVVQYDGVPPFRETRAYVAKITAAVGALPPTDRVSEPLRQGHPVVSTKNPEKDLSVWQY